MNGEELNKYIKHYIEHDMTKRAIMLSGDWGIGKSYYIQHELIPYLQSAEYSCIVVSLYDLKDTSEISKSIYLESRLKFLNTKSEVFVHGKYAAKSVIKGITSFFGVDLSHSEKDLKEIYESIDLKDKLIILEDIERSEIDILKVLGYVNSLVEQDGAKVLLVANENEILHYNYSSPDKDGKRNKTPDAKTASYLKSKEKTVCDTIVFHGNLYNAVKTIISSFDNVWLSSMAKDETTINAVVEFMYHESTNLRTLIYAFQKISDIFNMIDNHDEDLLKTIFFSVINFSVQIKGGSFPKWEGTDLVSTELGYSKYPLYRFCYNYIRWQEFDKTKVNEAIEDHKMLMLYDKHIMINDDNDLKVLFDYYIHDEKEVRAALNNIESRLSDPKDIPFYCYGKLVYFLIECHFILGFDYTSCKEKMINNLRNREGDIKLDLLFLDHFDIDGKDKKEAFNEFANDIKEAIETPTNIFGFTYSPEEISELYTYVAKNNDIATSGHAFISKLNFDKLLDMIFVCNPSQLLCLREVFWAVYRRARKGDFVENDIVFMQSLLFKTQERISGMSDNDDKIIKLQLTYLISNLEYFIKQLS